MRFIIILSIISTAFGCSNSDGTAIIGAEYYRKVSTRAIKDIFPLYPISPDSARAVNCFQVSRDTAGRIIEIAFLKEGEPALNPAVNFAKLSIAYTDSSETWRLLDLDGRSCFPQSNIDHIVYYMDKNKFARKKTNFDADGNEVEDSIGVSTYLLVPDTKNRIAKVFRSNARGDTIIDNNGVYADTLIYDDRGNITLWSFYSRDGRLANSSQGIAITLFEYDQKGNIIEIRFLDAESLLAVNGELGFARIRTEYNEAGNVSSIAAYKPIDSVPDDSGSLFQLISIRYDDKGNKTKMSTRTFRDEIVQNEVEISYDMAGDPVTATYNFYVNEESDLAKAIVEYQNGVEVKRTYIDKYGNIR